MSTGILKFEQSTICVVGLGYVGLPLAVAFGKDHDVIGFDTNPKRIRQLEAFRDDTLEVSEGELREASRLVLSNDPGDLRQAKVFIVTVPTPVDTVSRPDLSMLKAASISVGEALSRGAVVVYESTVYPGCTEEICVPLLENASGLKLNIDFFVGYSPERINPGDKKHRLQSITKVTSGSTPDAADAIDRLYASIIPAGTHKAPSIKVAEAAKVIENTQRDVNIALMNELSLIFHRLNVDTLEVLAAARTKWNFLSFMPGLVGGHCVGVDPYYLAHKAEEVGCKPELILAGRRLNDKMGQYVADSVVQLMLRRRMHIAACRVLVLGLTFKENCPDVRNTKVVDIIHTLESCHLQVDVYDPWVDVDGARKELGIDCIVDAPVPGTYDAVIVAVAHKQFAKGGAAGVRAYGKVGAVIYDVKGLFSKADSDGRL